MKGWEVVRVSAAAGVGEEVAEGGAAGAEVACTAGAAFGGDGDGADPDPGRLSASATALLAPGVCRISVVYSVMYASWRCCLADQGGDTRPKAATSGDQRLVVSHHVELPPLQHKTEVPKGRKHCSELSIKRGVTTLSRRQLL
jgi:hypothetical protein